MRRMSAVVAVSGVMTLALLPRGADAQSGQSTQAADSSRRRTGVTIATGGGVTQDGLHMFTSLSIPLPARQFRFRTDLMMTSQSARVAPLSLSPLLTWTPSTRSRVAPYLLGGGAIELDGWLYGAYEFGGGVELRRKRDVLFFELRSRWSQTPDGPHRPGERYRRLPFMSIGVRF
jgi:hypothetical protein